MNRKPSFANVFFSVLIGLTLIFSAAKPINVSASPSPVKGDGIRRGVHPQTGMLTFLGADASNPIRVESAMRQGLAPEARGNSVLDVYGPEFGIRDAARELSMVRSSSVDGRLALRYQQVYNKIPVMGGELIVNMQADGSLLSISGEASPDLKVDTQPKVGTDAANQLALRSIAKAYNLKASDLTASKPELWIFDERLIQDHATQPVHLVWRMEVTAENAPVRELVLVNAKSGGISLHFNQIDTAWTGESIENKVERVKDDVTEPVVLFPVNTEPVAAPVAVASQPIGAPVPGTSLFVNAAGGNDANDCLYPASACLTINGAIAKPQAEGNTIYVAEGTYTGSGVNVVNIYKNVTLSGGWNSVFTTQTGYSTIDGENARRGLMISFSYTTLTAVVDRFIIQRGYWGATTYTGHTGGGGIYAAGNLVLSKVVVRDNSAVDSGGGIFVEGYQSVFSLTDSVVSNNTALKGGGGIFTWLSQPSSWVMNNSTVASNKAAVGGGIFGGRWEINNSTIAENKAVSGGGFGGGTITMNNSTVAWNIAGRGGAVSGSDIYLKNSILIGDENACDFYSSIISQGHNLFNHTCSIGLTSSDLDVTDPKIGPFIPALGYLPLRSDSPAINHGDPTTCYGTADQRGQSRVGTCDIGAFEYTTPGEAANILILDGDQQGGVPFRDYTKPLSAVVLDGGGNLVPGISVSFASPNTGATVLFNTGTHTEVVTTGNDGIAKTSTLTANGEYGTFSVLAAVSGKPLSVNFSLENLMWTVSPIGSDANTCKRPTEPCQTIQAAVSKSNPGDTIFVTQGVYQGFGPQGLELTKDVNLSGGWNDTFDSQTGYTTIDGEGVHRVVTVGSQSNFGSVTVDRFIITNGKTPDVNTDEGFGGGIFIHSGSTSTLTNSIVSNNSATCGGGIAAVEGTNLVIDNVVIKNNRAVYSTTEGFGGGLCSFSTFTMSNSSIYNNYAQKNGGGIYAGDRIDGYVESAGVITNSTIAANYADDSGGGIYRPSAGYISGVPGELVLNNVTVTENRARYGGGTYSKYRVIVVENTIVANNHSVFDNGEYEQHYGNCDGGPLQTLGTQNIVYPRCAMGDTAMVVDPKLGAFVPELGYAPLYPDSPAINAGDTGTCVASGDQRGQARNGACDIGAIEHVTNSGAPDRLLYVSGSAQRSVPNADFANPLVAVVVDANGNPVANESVTFIAPASGPSASLGGSGTNATNVLTDSGGYARLSALTANAQSGNYIVTTTYGAGSVNYSIANGLWYVVPAADGGNDANVCNSIAAPCATINGVLAKPDFYAGDVIHMARGSYPAPDVDVVLSKNMSVRGGWDLGFLSQTGVSILDFTAYPTRTTTVFWDATVSLEKIGLLKTQLLNNGHLYFDSGSILNGKGVRNFGQVSFQNATIAGNTSTTVYPFGSYGGGLYSRGVTRFVNSTISGNSATQGGGIYGLTVLINTIVAGNTATQSGPDCHGDMVSMGNNIIGDLGVKGTFGYPCRSDWSGTDWLGVSTDPIPASLIMGNLQQDGLTGQWHFPLKLGSYAIDAVNTVTTGGGSNACPAMDQLGVTRPQGQYCDIGAVEYQFNYHPPENLLATYDAGNTTTLPGTQVCSGNDATCAGGDAHETAAHANAFSTYQWYQTWYGRDSIDGNGLQINSAVHYGSGYQNAFWNGQMMVYGDGYGFPLADDVVAHELTHGVTQYESNLFYWYQSGAINESFSDLWGEAVDQANGLGNDSSAVKWLIGEDVTGLGAIRNMQNPPLKNQPDSMTSTKYCKGGSCLTTDNGGVHTNSGVNNKAVYLMVEGGTFNTKIVSPLGWNKVLAIYYEAQTNLLTSGSDYLDLYNALYQACQNKIGTSGIILADCQEVRDATDAVKMNAQPALNFNPDADYCPSGTSKLQDLYVEDFETDTSNWTFTFVPNINVLPSESAWGLSSANTASGNFSLWADDGYAEADSVAAMNTGVTLPANSKPFLHFAHAYNFDAVYFYYYDGGVLEYSTDGGVTWLDAKPLYSAGQNYKGTLTRGYGNPLEARSAFAGDSHGYVDSRYKLESLAGQTVRFRWRMGTDQAYYVTGWYVDDVRIYTCVGVPSVPMLSAPALNALVTDYTPVFDWSDSTPASDLHHYDLQLATDSAFTIGVVNFTNIPASTYTPLVDLTSNTKYHWRVRSVNAAGGTSAWTASRYFRSALLPPVAQTPGVDVPAFAPNLHMRRPTFTWDAVPGATTYTVEVSTATTFATKVVNATTSATSYTHTLDLAANTTYYWRVKANGTNGPSLYSSPLKTFSTGNPPSVPTLAAPAANALLTTLTPLLNWNNSTVPAGAPGFHEYVVQIASDSLFNSVVETIHVSGIANSETVTPALLNGATYYWRVRSVNVGADAIGGNADDDFSGWSLSRSFRIAYAAPVLNLPLDGAINVALKPTFTWTAIPGATSYNLQVSTLPTFLSLAVNKTINAPVTSYTHTLNLKANTVYYWRVRANGAYGPGFWQSPVFSFTTTP